MFNDAESEIKALREALKPFAEKPTDEMDNRFCHNDLCTKEECSRCGKAIFAWQVLNYNSHTGEFDRKQEDE